jgi:hypothetical protein
MRFSGSWTSWVGEQAQLHQTILKNSQGVALGKTGEKTCHKILQFFFTSRPPGQKTGFEFVVRLPFSYYEEA